MRFHNTNKLIFSHSLLVLVLWSGGTVRAPGHKTGKLVGNMIFVDSGENLTLGDAANTTNEANNALRIIVNYGVRAVGLWSDMNRDQS